mgnify:CR=1 FL=1
MKKFLSLAMAGAMALSMAACGGATSSSTAASTGSADSTAASTTAQSTASGDQVTLNWAVWDKESTAYWQAMADGYMAANPNVTIEMTDLGSTDYMTQLATQLAGGNGELDILTIKDIPGYSNLINLEMLVPMNDILERPTTFFVVIMLTISSFKVYDQMYMITQGGPGNATMTLVYDIYNVAFVNTPRYGYASAISMVLFVLVLVVTIIQFRGSAAND